MKNPTGFWNEFSAHDLVDVIIFMVLLLLPNGSILGNCSAKSTHQAEQLRSKALDEVLNA